MDRFDALTVSLDGVSLVEASAGTGKTHAITTLIVRLIVEQQLPIQRILIVTFTEAATAELRARVRARLVETVRVFDGRLAGDNASSGAGGDVQLLEMVTASATPKADRARVALALADIDDAAIHTIHGFCHRVLQEAAFATGADFSGELITDVRPLVREVMADFWGTELASSIAGATRAEQEQEHTRFRLLRRERATGWLDQLTSELLRHSTAVAHPQHPPPLSPVDCTALAEAFRAAHEAWDRPVVEALLSQSKALSGAVYRPERVAAWCDELVSLFALEQPDQVLRVERLKYFTATHLAGNCRKSAVGEEPQHPFFNAAERLFDQRTRLIDAASRELLALSCRWVDALRSELARRKRSEGVLSFDDLLLQVAGALQHEGGASLAAMLRARYPAALIDEFQDTDPVQYSIFRTVWPQGALFLIGDPKQAIYAFRGADVFAYMSAAQSARNRFTMAVNWRSDPSLVRAVAAIFAGTTTPFLLDEIRVPRVHARDGASDGFLLGGARAPALEVLFVERDEGGKAHGAKAAASRLPVLVAGEIAALLASDATIAGRRVGAGDVAVLTRSNAEAFDLQAALRGYAIASVVLGDQSVFEDSRRYEARELAHVLAAIVEPSRSSLVRAALITEIIGLTAEDLCQLERADGADEWVDRFRGWHRLWVARGFVSMFRDLLERARVRERLIALSDGERRLTNLLHLMELLHQAESTQHLGPSGLLHWFQGQRESAKALHRPEEAQIRLESDERAVKITTVHRAKGLEYPIVYCPFLWRGAVEPRDAVISYHDGERRHIELAREPADAARKRARAAREALSERLRVAYVALTRARHRCTIVWGAMSGYASSALGYLLHPPPRAASRGAELSLEALKAQVGALDDARMWSDLEACVAREPDAMAARRVRLDEPREVPATKQREGRAVRFACREAPRETPRGWRTTSFSGMVASRTTPAESSEGRDHDAVEVVSSAPEGVVRDGAERIALAEFPRGARAGSFFHEVFEHIDFTDPESFAPVLRKRLDAYGYDVAVWLEPLSTVLRDLVNAPLRGARAALRLSALSRGDRLDELEFHLPVAAAVLDPRIMTSAGEAPNHGTQLDFGFSQGELAPLDPRGLAAALHRHGRDAHDAHYAEQVRRLRFAPLDGFVKGYIDLVFRHDGRFYVADYKSNFLGEDYASYGTESLRGAMAHGHYYLQYLLYALAVHRHLATRIPDYSYERHFGGVLYLFLRGMRRDDDCGVFFDRPAKAHIDALSELFVQPRECA